MAPDTAAATTDPARGERALLLALALAAMIVSMMQTMVVPILGLIQTTLHTTTAAVSWVNTATLLSAAVFTPLLGRVGDQHGKKRTLLAVLLVMTAGSVLAATTHSLTWLITARVLQGSATAIFPLALSLLRQEIRPHRLPGAMALVSGTLGFGGGIALVLTGVLTQDRDADYRRVFWVAAALAVAALIAVATAVPTDRDRPGGRTDILGALTFSALLTLLLLPITQGGEWGWTAPSTLGCFLGAAVMAAVWTLTEQRVREPMIDLGMFTHRPVLFTNIAGLLIGFMMFAQFIGISYLAQMPARFAGYGFSASVLRASVEYLLPSTLTSLVAAPLGGVLVKRHGPRLVLALSGITGVIGFLWITLAHDTTASVIGASLVTGATLSLAYAAMPALIAANVSRETTGIANGVNSIARSVGSAIGSATITTLLAAKTLHGLPPGVPELPAESQFTLSFIFGAVACGLVAVVAVLGLTPAHSPRTPEPSRERTPGDTAPDGDTTDTTEINA